MAVKNERVLTGNRVIIRANSGPNAGRVLGLGVAGSFGTPQDVSGSHDFGLQDVYVLGHADRQELVIGATRHSITVNTLRLNAKDAGFDPRDIILNDSDMSIDIVDKKGGEVLESFSGCMCRTRNWSVARNGIATQSLVFEALRAEKTSVDD